MMGAKGQPISPRDAGHRFGVIDYEEKGSWQRGTLDILDNIIHQGGLLDMAAATD
jgi:hypothetical protein